MEGKFEEAKAFQEQIGGYSRGKSKVFRENGSKKEEKECSMVPRTFTHTHFCKYLYCSKITTFHEKHCNWKFAFIMHDYNILIHIS